MSTDTTIHVAAMPFPTAQGTQASIRAMLDVLAALGRDVHLITYARGAFEIAHAFALHRAPGVPGRDDFRSGPSLRKVAEDVALARELRRIARRIRPCVVIAHHVEAAAACIAARVEPWVFVAHTDLAPELPTYGPRAAAGVLQSLGAAIDRAVATRASTVAAISPALCDTLEARVGRDIHYLPVPWPVPPPRTDEERRLARIELGIPEGDDVLLYAGNLDAYQGWESIVTATRTVADRRPRARLLVATESDRTPLDAAAAAARIQERLVVAPLAGEPARRRAHAAADLALIPRRAPGGLPIKLLDALARGVPTIAAARAAAGLDLRGAALLVADDDPDALAFGALTALGAPEATHEIGERGRDYVATDHAPARFVEAFDRMVIT